MSSWLGSLALPARRSRFVVGLRTAIVLCFLSSSVRAFIVVGLRALRAAIILSNTIRVRRHDRRWSKRRARLPPCKREETAGLRATQLSVSRARQTLLADRRERRPRQSGCRGGGLGANGAFHEVPHQRHLVAVVPQHLRAL